MAKPRKTKPKTKPSVVEPLPTTPSGDATNSQNTRDVTGDGKTTQPATPVLQAEDANGPPPPPPTAVVSSQQPNNTIREEEKRDAENSRQDKAKDGATPSQAVVPPTNATSNDSSPGNPSTMQRPGDGNAPVPTPDSSRSTPTPDETTVEGTATGNLRTPEVEDADKANTVPSTSVAASTTTITELASGDERAASAEVTNESEEDGEDATSTITITVRPPTPNIAAPTDSPSEEPTAGEASEDITVPSTVSEPSQSTREPTPTEAKAAEAGEETNAGIEDGDEAKVMDSPPPSYAGEIVVEGLSELVQIINKLGESGESGVTPELVDRLKKSPLSPAFEALQVLWEKMSAHVLEAEARSVPLPSTPPLTPHSPVDHQTSNAGDKTPRASSSPLPSMQILVLQESQNPLPTPPPTRADQETQTEPRTRRLPPTGVDQEAQTLPQSTSRPLPIPRVSREVQTVPTPTTSPRIPPVRVDQEVQTTPQSTPSRPSIPGVSKEVQTDPRPTKSRRVPPARVEQEVQTDVPQAPPRPAQRVLVDQEVQTSPRKTQSAKPAEVVHRWDGTELKSLDRKVNSLSSKFDDVSQTLSGLASREDVSKSVGALGEKLSRVVSQNAEELRASRSATSTRVEKVDKNVSQMSSNLDKSIADLRRRIEESKSSSTDSPSQTTSRFDKVDTGVSQVSTRLDAGIADLRQRIDKLANRPPPATTATTTATPDPRTRELEVELKDAKRMMDATRVELVKMEGEMKVALEGKFPEDPDAYYVGSESNDGGRDTAQIARGLRTNTLRLISRCRTMFNLVSGKGSWSGTAVTLLEGEWKKCFEDIKARDRRLLKAVREKDEATADLRFFTFVVDQVKRGFYNPTEWRIALAGDEFVKFSERADDGLEILQELGQEMYRLQHSRPRRLSSSSTSSKFDSTRHRPRVGWGEFARDSTRRSS